MLDRFGDAPVFFLVQLFLTWGPRGPWIVFRESVNLVGGGGGGDYNFIFTNL